MVLKNKIQKTIFWNLFFSFCNILIHLDIVFLQRVISEVLTKLSQESSKETTSEFV